MVKHNNVDFGREIWHRTIAMPKIIVQSGPFFTRNHPEKRNIYSALGGLIN